MLYAEWWKWMNPFPFSTEVRMSSSALRASPALANQMARVLVTTPPRSSELRYPSISDLVVVAVRPKSHAAWSRLTSSSEAYLRDQRREPTWPIR